MSKKKNFRGKSSHGTRTDKSRESRKKHWKKG